MESRALCFHSKLLYHHFEEDVDSPRINFHQGCTDHKNLRYARGRWKLLLSYANVGLGFLRWRCTMVNCWFSRWMPLNVCCFWNFATDSYLVPSGITNYNAAVKGNMIITIKMPGRTPNWSLLLFWKVNRSNFVSAFTALKTVLTTENIRRDRDIAGQALGSRIHGSHNRPNTDTWRKLTSRAGAPLSSGSGACFIGRGYNKPMAQLRKQTSWPIENYQKLDNLCCLYYEIKKSQGITPGTS